MKSFVSLSDIHYPYEDPKCLELVRAFLKDFQPDILILNGDIFDMPQISKFHLRRKEVMLATNIQSDIDHGHAGLELLMDAAKAKEILYPMGNHEDRWEAFLGAKAPELASLRALTIEELLVPDGVKYTSYGNGYWLNDSLFIYHGLYIGKNNWTDAERLQIGASSITGHRHHQRVTYFTSRKQTFKNIAQGCLCKLDPPYLRSSSDWQQGFVYGYIIDDDKFRAIEVEIVTGDDTIWMAPEGTLYQMGTSADLSGSQHPSTQLKKLSLKKTKKTKKR